jgi:hypothetical protein
MVDIFLLLIKEGTEVQGIQVALPSSLSRPATVTNG